MEAEDGGGAVNDAVASAARAPARRLVGTLGPRVEADVVRALHEAAPRRPDQYFDPVSLGAPIVSAASFAWGLYKDFRDRGETPQSEHLARGVRIKIRMLPGASSAQGDQIVEVVVDEVMAAGGQAPVVPPPGDPQR